MILTKGIKVKESGYLFFDYLTYTERNFTKKLILQNNKVIRSFNFFSCQPTILSNQKQFVITPFIRFFLLHQIWLESNPTLKSRIWSLK